MIESRRTAETHARQPRLVRSFPVQAVGTVGRVRRAIALGITGHLANASPLRSEVEIDSGSEWHPLGWKTQRCRTRD